MSFPKHKIIIGGRRTGKKDKLIKDLKQFIEDNPDYTFMQLKDTKNETNTKKG